MTDSTIEEIIGIERKLWSNDASFYEDNLVKEALLAFPETGIITRDVAVDAIRKENAENRRWAEVKFDQVRFLTPANDARVLVYKVHSDRTG